MATKKTKPTVGTKTDVKLPKHLRRTKPKQILAPDNPRMLNLKKGKPFQKGFDERRNLNGPPRDVDYLRKFIQDIFAEDVKDEVSGKSINTLRLMILGMITSKAASDHVSLLQYGFGKVPDEIIFTTDDLKKIVDFLPDDMVQLLAKGENLTDVIIEFIKSHSDGA